MKLLLTFFSFLFNKNETFGATWISHDVEEKRFFFFLNASIYLKCEESRKDLIEIVHLFNKLILRIVGIIEMY